MANNANRRSNPQSYRGSRRQQSRQNDNSGCLSYITIATIIIVIVTIVFFLIIANIFKSGSEHKNSNWPSDLSSQISSQEQTIIEFDDDETSSDDISSDVSSDVSSESTHPSFEGTWKKTDVYQDAKGTITISNQTNDGFDFKMEISANSKSEKISGTASFKGEKSAVYKKGSASITFEFGSKYLSIYHSGTNSALGFSSAVSIDGKFTTGTPNYYTKEETNTYDCNVYKSKAVVNALKSTLSADDYALYTELMEKGLMSPIAYERTVDKNGNKINVDTELKCVKYNAVLSSIGMNMVMICSNDGKIYVLFYDIEEMRYYTNDKNYSSKMPQSFQNIANSKGMKPIFK